MGKLGPRLSSRKKAKRWPKGQSSNSNPQTQKHRDQARSRFFHQNIATTPGFSSTTGLTSDALKKHDALQGLAPAQQIDIDTDEISAEGTFKTFDTFASCYSNCTNISFSRFLSRFQSSSVIHKEMLAILAAVTEVIKQNGGTESSTEYYAALMTTLEQAESEESVAAVLSLLGMGLKTVPKNVLKLQFGQASHVFIEVLTKYATSENFLIIRHCIGCLSILMRTLEAAVWSNSSTMQILDGILAFTIHTKPKVRKAAQHAICAILKGSDLMKNESNLPTYHPAASQVAKHCLNQFKNAGKPGTITTILHMLTMLKDIVHQLPKSCVKSICESLLRIMTLKNPLIMSCSLQTFHNLFISRPSETVLPSQLNAQIINALYDYQPAAGDTQPTLAWLAVMLEAHANLISSSPYLCAANLPRIIEKSIELWLSDKSEVITAASHTIKTLLQICVAPLCENKQVATKYHKTLRKIFLLIRQGMKYQYNAAWHHVLHLIAVLFQIAGATCQDDLSPILVELAELRDSYKFTYNSEVEYAVGAAVKLMGPEIVLSKIPLFALPNGFNMKRSWLLPVLKDCISQATLLYFINNVFPMANWCEVRQKELKQKNDGIGAHSYELLTSQIWALLPSFCNHANDIKENFKIIARSLGTIISDRKDLRTSVMAALRKLITKSLENDKKDDIEEISRFAKNYLPLLLNLYTTQPNGSDEEGQRLAAFDTIKVYLTITSKELCGELFDRALEKISDNENSEFVKHSVFDLIRILTQFTDRKRLQDLYEKCIPILMNNKNAKDQKKAYRFLEDICGSSSEMCKDFVTENRKAIQKILVNASQAVCATSRGARLRCIDYLVENHPRLEKTEFLKAIVPEIVICIKNLNEKCRISAYKLLNTIADKFMANPGYFDEFVQMLLVGIGGTPDYVSATLLSLANLTYKYNGSIGTTTNQEILSHTCSLVTGPTREVVLSALSYIKVYLSSFPTLVIGPNLQIIIEGLTAMTDDCKRHFRQKVRDILVKLIRKFGIENIAGMIPLSDELMHKRIKNIRKVEARKQKMREERKEQDHDSDNEDEFDIKRRPKSMEEILADSDEDFDDMDSEMIEKTGGNKKKAVRQTWIQENADNIVDFADPSAAKNITATKPGQSLIQFKKPKPKDHGFKISEDGRLIIKDSDGDDSEVEGEKKKKSKKLPFLGTDSDNDNEDDDDDENDNKSEISAKPTRKRRLSGSTDANSVATSKYKAGGSGIHRPLKVPKCNKTPGIEYKSIKATGDIKKKGKPDPYAYLPLTRAALNRRKKLKNKGKYKSIISGAKKGAKNGSKVRRKNNKV